MSGAGSRPAQMRAALGRVPWPIYAVGAMACIVFGAAIIVPRTLPVLGPILVLAVLSTAPPPRVPPASALRDPPMWLFPAVVGFSIAWSQAPQVSWRSAAIVLLAVLIAYCGALDNQRRDRIWHGMGSRSLVAAFLVALAYLWIELFGNMPIRRWAVARYGLSEHGELYTDTLNRSLGVLTIMLWPTLVAVSALSPRIVRLPLAVALVGGTVAAIFASVHETSMVAVIAGLVIFAVGAISRDVATWLLRFAWLMATLMVVPAVMTLHAFDLQHAGFVPRTGQARIIIWDATAEQIRAAPLLGIGVNSSASRPRDETRPAGRPGEHEQVRTTDHHPHNAYLQVWAELGVVGAVAFAIFGLALVDRLRLLSRGAQPYAHAMAMVVMVEIATGWGLWQAWLLVALALAAWALTVGDGLVRTRLAGGADAPSRSDALVAEGFRLSRPAAFAGVAVASVALLHFAAIQRHVAGTARSTALVPEALAGLDRVEACLGEAGNAGEACRADARKFLGTLARTRFEIRKPGPFTVYVHEDRIVFHRAACSDSDLAAAPFVWAVYPPTARRKADGRPLDDDYVAGTIDLARRSIRVDGACLVIDRLPMKEFLRFDAGQYDRGRGRWLWHVRSPGT